MKTIVFLSLIAFAKCQVSDLIIRTALDGSFHHWDAIKKDNLLTVAEWDAIIANNDQNNDGCLSEVEYIKAHPKVPSDALNASLFKQFDHDSNGCLKVSEMTEEFNTMDADGNGIVNIQEFENHMTGIAKKAINAVFSNGVFLG